MIINMDNPTATAGTMMPAIDIPDCTPASSVFFLPVIPRTNATIAKTNPTKGIINAQIPIISAVSDILLPG